MRRLLLIPVALLGLACAGAFASIKQANATAVGTISSLKTSSITVGKHTAHLSCKLTAYSPSTKMFAVGDRVKIACSNHVLVGIADVPGPSNSRKDDAKSSGGDGPTTNTTTTTSVTGADGPLTALNTTSISVQTMKCSVGPSSPSTAGFQLGDSVRMYCLNGVLYQLKHNDTPPPPPTTTTTTTTTTTEQNYSAITGTLGAITTGSITATNTGGGDGPPVLTCTIGASSPSTAGFASGNLVRMYCLNGSLYQLKHNDTSPPTTSTTTTTTPTTTTTTQQNYTGVSGAISALADGSITATNTGGGDGPPSLTCTIGPSSPSTSGFSVGSAVRMYCLNGSLYQLKHNDTSPPTTSTTTTTTTSTHN